MTRQEILKMLESTLLRATATAAEVESLCAEARAYGFGLVMINPRFVPLAKARLSDSSVRVGTVIDFPLGAGSDEDKATGIRSAIRAGADEVDLVAGVNAALGNDWQAYADMLYAARAAAGNAVLKVILETCYLDEEQILKASALCTRAGVDFVKTSTGFGTRGASVEDILLMKRATVDTAEILGVKPCGVKASGGIKTLDQVLRLALAGAERIGTSAAASVADELAAVGGQVKD